MSALNSLYMHTFSNTQLSIADFPHHRKNYGWTKPWFIGVLTCTAGPRQGDSPFFPPHEQLTWPRITATEHDNGQRLNRRNETFVFPPNTLFVYNERPELKLIRRHVTKDHGVTLITTRYGSHKQTSLKLQATVYSHHSTVTIAHGDHFIPTAHLPHGILFILDEHPC